MPGKRKSRCAYVPLKNGQSSFWTEWTMKEIIMGVIMFIETVLVIPLLLVLACKGNYEQNTPAPEPNSYPITTTTPSESQENHFNLLPNAMALICEINTTDPICLNLTVFNTKSDEMAKMKIMKNVEDSFNMSHPFGQIFDGITLSKGNYSVQFNMSIFRHMKRSNTDPSTYGVTTKLDEKTLVSCLPGQLETLPTHEWELCKLRTLDQKYSVDLDRKYSFVWSMIAFNLKIKVERDGAKLNLMFAKEGFIDKATLTIAKKL